MMKVVFTGGGTGGHVMPIVAIGRELRKLYRGNDLKIYYFGPKDRFSFDLLKKEGFIVKRIVSGKLRRYFSLKNIIDIFFKFPIGFLQSFFLFLLIDPKLIFSKGGTGSLPVAFCARILRVPVFLHESDIVPGLSNQKASKWGKKIFTSFEKTEIFNESKIIFVGNPIRKELLLGEAGSAQKIFNLTLEKPVVLIWGGSQGSEPINDFIMIILNELLKKYEAIHICGPKNYKKIKVSIPVILSKDLEKYYHLYDSLEEGDLKHALKAANVIVSRSGSASIFEIAALGKPSILIPLPSSAGNHQSKNAYSYARSGAAIVMEQKDLTPNFFLGEIDYLVSQPEKFSQAALKFAKPEAATNIAKVILEYLQ